MHNALTLLVAAAGSLFTIASIFAVFALRRAPVGYQDEHGFHQEAEPAPSASYTAPGREPSDHLELAL